MLWALVGAALALPPPVLGPDGPMWVGPLRPVAALRSEEGAGPFVVVDPSDGQLWVEERLPSGAIRIWKDGGWWVDGAQLDVETPPADHRIVDGTLSSARGAHGETRGFRYDESGRLIRITWPNGAAVTVQYGPENRVLGLSGPGSGRWRYDWDQGLSVLDPLGRTLAIRIDDGDFSRSVTVRDGLGRTVRSSYEALPEGRWRLTGWQNPRGLKTRIIRKEGRLEVRDPAGRIYRLRIDETDRIVQLTMPGGQRWGWSRDAAGRVRRIHDPAGRVTRWERDDAGRVVGIVRAGHHTRYRRDAAGRVTSVVASAGGTTELNRDEHGRILSIRDAAGSAVFFERHENGWPTTILNRTGARYGVGMDLLGRPSRFEDPSGAVWKIGRDATGRVDRLEHPVHGATKISHTQDGHITQVVDEAGHELRLGWDGAGRLSTLKGSERGAIRLERDLAGDVVKVKQGEVAVVVQRDPTGLVTQVGDVQWSRDFSGQVSGVSLPGLALRFDREPAGWLRSLSADPWVLDIHRDGAGWPVGWTGTDGTIDLRRDGSGRIVSETGERTLSVRRGGRGQVAQVSGKVGEWRWLRDAAGRILRVHAMDGAKLGFDRDHAGRVTLVRFPSGALVRRQHLPDGVLELVVDPGGAMIDARTTRWDAEGRVVSVTNQAEQGRRWRRNLRGELVGVDIDDLGAWTWTSTGVDGPAGEFMLRDDSGAISEIQLPETLSAWGQQTRQIGFHRMETGHLRDITGDEGQTLLAHDPVGRLKSVRLPDGRRWTLSYDVRGRPAQVVDPDGGVHTFVWMPTVQRPQGVDLLAVIGPEGITRHVRGPGGSGTVENGTRVELVMTADGDPAWLLSRSAPPESMSASPLGWISGPVPRWMGAGGRLSVFPGGPLLIGTAASDPLSGARTDGVQPWPWVSAPVRADGTEDRWDPEDWRPQSPWGQPLALLEAMGELQPIDDGSWWSPGSEPVAVPWLPASLDKADPPIGVAVDALPLSPMDPITAAWLRQVLNGTEAQDLGLPAREVLMQELGLPWLPPGLMVPGLGSWGLGSSEKSH